MDLHDKYIWDIYYSIQKIHQITQTKGLRFDVFQNDILYQDAIQWNIAIIGEAMNKLLEIDPNIKITDCRKIVNCRNYLIHAYDSFQPELIWAIVVNKIPKLEEDIKPFVLNFPDYSNEKL